MNTNEYSASWNEIFPGDMIIWYESPAYPETMITVSLIVSKASNELQHMILCDYNRFEAGKLYRIIAVEYFDGVELIRP